MSETCLSESLHYLASKIDSRDPSKMNNSENQFEKYDEMVFSPNEADISKESISLKQPISRKREASTVLMESGKRRDNFRNFNYEINVPSQDNSIKSSSYSDTSLLKSEQSARFEILCVADLSDSASTSDSGIDISSKGSSPCHSIDISVSPDDGDENPSHMEIESAGHLPILPHDSSLPVNDANNQSHVPIYEDLHSLNLKDEIVAPEDTPTKSPISKSLFNNVAPTIYFSSKEEKVAPLPDDVLPLLTWKLSTITPLIVKEIVVKSGFSLLDSDTTADWLGTWGKHLKCNSFKRIKNYQKINHYPGSFHLGRKDKLWINYKRMQARYGEDIFNFFPQTYHLPHDMTLLKNIWDGDDEKCWIIKPPASARGTGVKVIHKWSQIPKNKPIMVQRYLSDPYLINATKFDLRIYVLVGSFDPLRVYMFDDGLVRFASEKYSHCNKSFSNRYVHLTNYSINKKSSSYTSNDDENLCQGHKWTLKTFWTYMSNSGIDVENIQEAIVDMVIKTVISVEQPICRLTKTYSKSSYSCYELFGFDIMLDKNLRPWLLEVNISPSLHIRSKLDRKIKGPMVKDMMNMAAFLVPESRSSSLDSKPVDYGFLCPVATRHRAQQLRYLSDTEKEKHSVFTLDIMLNGILNHLTPDDVRCLIESEDEYHRRGSFIRIFPTPTTSKYFEFFEHTRYYNLLLDAWEKKYCSKRSEGISLLQDLCDKKFHLQTVLNEKPEIEESEIEITVH